MQDPKPGAAHRRLLSPGVNAGALRRILVNQKHTYLGVWRKVAGSGIEPLTSGGCGKILNPCHLCSGLCKSAKSSNAGFRLLGIQQQLIDMCIVSLLSEEVKQYFSLK